jgi:hypothetical protein
LYESESYANIQLPADSAPAPIERWSGLRSDKQWSQRLIELYGLIQTEKNRRCSRYSGQTEQTVTAENGLGVRSAPSTASRTHAIILPQTKPQAPPTAPTTTTTTTAMFAQTPLRARLAAAKTLSAQSSRAYSSRAADMPARNIPIRTLLRSTLPRASTTLAQRAPPYLSSAQLHTQTQTQSRARSPSPAPRYEVRNQSLLAAPGGWTRFSTHTSLSSVRTFTSSPKIAWPGESSSSSADNIPAEQQKVIEEHIEAITELFGTAKDEFEIAAEETEKNTTYAEADREACREELERLLEYYGRVVSESEEVVGQEVKRRVGHRIRELKAGVEAMEARAIEHD